MNGTSHLNLSYGVLIKSVNEHKFGRLWHLIVTVYKIKYEINKFKSDKYSTLKDYGSWQREVTLLYM